MVNEGRWDPVVNEGKRETRGTKVTEGRPVLVVNGGKRETRGTKGKWDFLVYPDQRENRGLRG